MQSKFHFLENKYPKLFLISQAAEELSFTDTSSCLTKCRVFCEEMLYLIRTLEKLEDCIREDFLAKIKDLKNKNIISKNIYEYFDTIREFGNIGAHEHLNKEDLSNCDTVLKVCYNLSVWFYYTYEGEYIEDHKYENLNKVMKTNETTDAKIEKAPSYDGNLEHWIAQINKDDEQIKKRRKRSKKLDKKLFGLSELIGIGGGALALGLVGISPVGIAAGLASGIGWAVYRYRGKFKNGKDD